MIGLLDESFFIAVSAMRSADVMSDFTAGMCYLNHVWFAFIDGLPKDLSIEKIKCIISVLEAKVTSLYP
jgi:hypothetical protein